MTKAMYNKVEKAVKEFQNVYPDRYVNNWKFKHYGKVYRIEENIERFKIYRVNPNSIHDALIAVINK
jgi:hypothetical protein